MRPLPRFSPHVLFTSWALACSTVCAQQPSAPDFPPNGTTPPTAQEPAKLPAELPHVRFDREKRFVDFDATVVTRECDWLELFVCKAGTREYESILTTPAQPSHIHLALLAIGVKPGQPMSWERRDDKLISHPATGDQVTVSVVVREDHGEGNAEDRAEGKKEREIPARDWIIHAETKAPMKDSRWIFAGSRFKEVRGRQIYLADVEGNVLSLVNFGDDLLVQPSTMEGGQGHGNPDWVPNTDALPPRGTKVVVRLRPIEKQADEHKSKPANPSEIVDEPPSPR